MADIKERIKGIADYFRGMQITTVDGAQLVYVIVQFPDKWIINDDIEEKYNVSVAEGEKRGEFYFCADIETGEDVVFDAIEYNINKMKDAIERARLLNEKIHELRELFENENISLQELRTLTFERDKKEADEIVVPTKKPSKKDKELIVEHTEENKEQEMAVVK